MSTGNEGIAGLHGLLFTDEELRGILFANGFNIDPISQHPAYMTRALNSLPVETYPMERVADYPILNPTTVRQQIYNYLCRLRHSIPRSFVPWGYAIAVPESLVSPLTLAYKADVGWREWDFAGRTDWELDKPIGIRAWEEWLVVPAITPKDGYEWIPYGVCFQEGDVLLSENGKEVVCEVSPESYGAEKVEYDLYYARLKARRKPSIFPMICPDGTIAAG